MCKKNCIYNVKEMEYERGRLLDELRAKNSGVTSGVTEWVESEQEGDGAEVELCCGGGIFTSNSEEDLGLEINDRYIETTETPAIVMKAEGQADDLLYVDEDNNYMALRFFQTVNGSEEVGLEITSQDEDGDNKFLKSLLGRKIRVAVQVVE